jgi:hypothetical protein
LAQNPSPVQKKKGVRFSISIYFVFRYRGEQVKVVHHVEVVKNYKNHKNYKVANNGKVTKIAKIKIYF